MKLMGAPINYCRQRESYYYSKEVKFVFGFQPKDINSSNVIGGIKNYNFFSLLPSYGSDYSFLCNINVENRN